MDAGITIQFESGSSQESASDQVFIDVLEPNGDGRICCQPPRVTSSQYYSCRHTLELRRRTEMIEEQAAQNEKLLEMHSHIQRQDTVLLQQ